MYGECLFLHAHNIFAVGTGNVKICSRASQIYLILVGAGLNINDCYIMVDIPQVYIITTFLPLQVQRMPC